MDNKVKIFDYLSISNIHNIFLKNTEIYVLKENLLYKLLNSIGIKKIKQLNIIFNKSNFENIEKFTSIYENDDVGNFIYGYLEFIETDFKDKNFVNFVIKYLSNNSNIISFLILIVSFAFKLDKSLFLIEILPFDSISFKIAKTKDVLPDPDSPTIPIVSFSCKLKLSFFIAFT